MDSMYQVLVSGAFFLFLYYHLFSSVSERSDRSIEYDGLVDLCRTLIQGQIVNKANVWKTIERVLTSFESTCDESVAFSWGITDLGYWAVGPRVYEFPSCASGWLDAFLLFPYFRFLFFRKALIGISIQRRCFSSVNRCMWGEQLISLISIEYSNPLQFLARIVDWSFLREYNRTSWIITLLA